MKRKEVPLVSIWCFTYNHEKYIRDALNGFLNQKTTFPYEIVIHDDASTDNTQLILKEYEEKYPQLIRVVYRKENIYSQGIWYDVMSQLEQEILKGKYIAYCEGDDYWIDENKLQIQVDYLEQNTDCFMVSHNARQLNYITNESRLVNLDYLTGDVPWEQIIMQSDIILPTASLVARREILYRDKIFHTSDVGDWALKLFSATKGRIYYFENVMSVYRYMHSGSWSKNIKEDIKKYILHCIKMIVFFEKYNFYTDRVKEEWIISIIHLFIEGIIRKYQEINDRVSFELIEEIDKETNYVYNSYFKKIKKLYRFINDERYVYEELKEFCIKNDNIYIWGIGKYGTICAKHLEYMGIDIKGYLVTKKNNIDAFREKEVWEIENFYNKFQNSAIVIAISPQKWYEIKPTIDKFQLENYYCPFNIYN